MKFKRTLCQRCVWEKRYELHYHVINIYICLNIKNVKSVSECCLTCLTLFLFVYFLSPLVFLFCLNFIEYKSYSIFFVFVLSRYTDKLFLCRSVFFLFYFLFGVSFSCFAFVDASHDACTHSEHPLTLALQHQRQKK